MNPQDVSLPLREDELVYLRAETKLEPLVCGWYAWTHLASPLQHAMNVAYRHIPLLKSFVKNPKVHIAAGRDPTLFGGPFVDLSQERVADVQRLLEETQQRCGRLVQLAQDFRALDAQLQASASGYSLSDFYPRLPESLRGLVEFVYDLNNHPKVRVFEELLYDEYASSVAEEVALTLTPDVERTFFMSTPRLRDEATEIFRMPFTDERVDLLASMRTRPQPVQRALEALEVSAETVAKCKRYFTRTPPMRTDPEYSGSGVRVRYFGHACVLIQTAGTSILLDPMLAWDANRGDGRYTFNDLPDRIDYVVLSHNHQDHCAPEMLIQLRERIGRVLVPHNNSGSIADPSMRLVLERLGIRAVDVMSAFTQVGFAEGSITSLPFPGEHVDLDIHTRHGIHIDVMGRKLAFLVDSDGWDPALFRRIARRVGKKLDGLFVGMECHGAPLTWLYGPLLTKPISRRDDESRRLSGLNGERAWQVLQEFETERVFVYAMGQEPWLRFIMGLQYTPESIQLREVESFLRRCRQAGIEAENLYISRQWEL